MKEFLVFLFGLFFHMPLEVLLSLFTELEIARRRIRFIPKIEVKHHLDENCVPRMRAVSRLFLFLSISIIYVTILCLFKNICNHNTSNFDKIIYRVIYCVLRNKSSLLSKNLPLKTLEMISFSSSDSDFEFVSLTSDFSGFLLTIFT